MSDTPTHEFLTSPITIISSPAPQVTPLPASPLMVPSADMQRSPTLSDRISDAPEALTLAERINDPPETPSHNMATPPLAYPIIPYLDNDGLVSHTHSEHGSDTDAGAIIDNVPEGFVLYNRGLANHVRYGCTINPNDGRDPLHPHYLKFNFDYVDHRHYVHAHQFNDNEVPYGWPLQAAPFEEPCVSPEVVDINNHTPFTVDYPYTPEVDIALYAIDDMELTADVDIHQALAEEERQLIHRCNEVNTELATIWSKLQPICSRLTHAHAYPRVHPYLNRQAQVPQPNHQWPGDLQQHELTMDEALGLSREGDVN